MAPEGDILKNMAEEVVRLRNRARVAEIEAQESKSKAEILEQTITRLAKGTGEISPETLSSTEAPRARRRSSAAPRPAPSSTDGAKHLDELSSRVRAALSRESLTTTQLAKTVHEAADALETKLRALAFEGYIHNLEPEAKKAVWTWKLGNQTDNKALYAELKRLLSERPLRRRDLVAATGADEKRVDNQLVEIRRKENVWIPNKGEADHWGVVFHIQDAAPPARFDGRLTLDRRRNKR